MNKKKRYKILSCLSNINNNPVTELMFRSSFELLISVILSAQSTDVSVNKVTSKLYAVANTPSDIISMGINGLTLLIKNIGLYNKKAVYIINTCKILLKKHNGLIPSSRKELESLPGVGRKTANIILNAIFNKKTIAVDTHVFRVCNRTNFVAGKTVIEVEKKLVRTVPDIFKLKFHNLFILHGRYICKSRIPKCKICIINKYCEFNEKTSD